MSTPLRKPAAYCYECGNPYPWTSDKIEAAKELVALSTTLKDQDKPGVIDAIILTSTETAGTPVAAEKLKRYWPTIGPTLQSVLTDLLSETAKKILFP